MVANDRHFRKGCIPEKPSVDKIRRVELRRIEDERRGSGRYDPQARFGREFWAEDCAVLE